MVAGLTVGATDTYQSLMESDRDTARSIQALTSALDALEGRFENVEDDVDDLEDNARATDQVIHALRQSVSDVESEVAVLRANSLTEGSTDSRRRVATYFNETMTFFY